jgi:hypothetical protein
MCNGQYFYHKLIISLAPSAEIQPRPDFDQAHNLVNTNANEIQLLTVKICSSIRNAFNFVISNTHTHTHTHTQRDNRYQLKLAVNQF